MITKITNEQSFQVLTNNFSISPSPTGYQLQISADGKNFTTLFSVGANTTRLVTGVAANSYYRLLGNVGDVVINWRTTCVSEGGGGDMSNYYTKAETEELIDAAVSGITVDSGAVETQILSHNYITSGDAKEQIESYHFITSADTDDFVTSADVKTQIEEYHYITSADTTDFVNSGQVENIVESYNYITSADTEVFVNSGQVETQILSHNYITSADTEDFVTSADVKTQIEEYHYITSADTANFLTSADTTNFLTSADTQNMVSKSELLEKEEVISTALNDLNDRIPDSIITSGDVQTMIQSATTNMVQSTTIRNIVSISQADYDALSGNTDSSTFYVII